MQMRRSVLAFALAAVVPFLGAQDKSVKQHRDNTSAKTSTSDAAATTNTSAKQTATPATKSGSTQGNASAQKGGASLGDQLDLNTATADQLKTLPGIGDAYAKRIIDGRPYSAKNQIVQRGIVPQKTYDGVKDKIVARRAGAAAKQ